MISAVIFAAATAVSLRRVRLGYGDVSIALPASATLRKQVGFEFVSYGVFDGRTQIATLYLGNNPGPAGTHDFRTISLKTCARGRPAYVVSQFGKKANAIEILLSLPHSSSDRYLWFTVPRTSYRDTAEALAIFRSLNVRGATDAC